MDQFGAERVRALHDLHSNVYRVDGGMDADAAALVLGYDSGRALVEALEASPKRAEAIRQTVDTLMTSRHGDMRLDGSIADRAMEALHNEKREDALAMELRALKRKQRETRPFVDLALKDQARAEKFWARGGGGRDSGHAGVPAGGPGIRREHHHQRPGPEPVHHRQPQGGQGGLRRHGAGGSMGAPRPPKSRRS